ncbi:hypothetical protein B7R53_05625, partial [Serratia marcescens]
RIKLSAFSPGARFIYSGRGDYPTSGERAVAVGGGEGGIVALLGMLLLVWAGLKLVARAYWRDKRAFACGKATSGEALGLCIALLPIVLHCQT